MKEVNIMRSWQSGVILLVAGPAMLALGIWVFFEGKGDSTAIGLICSAMGLVFTALGLFYLFSKKPVITLSEVGISAPNLKNGPVKWEQINTAYMSRNGKQRFLDLEVDNTYPVTEPGWLAKEINKVTKANTARKVQVAASEISTDGLYLVKFVLAMKQADAATRVQLLDGFNPKGKG